MFQCDIMFLRSQREQSPGPWNSGGDKRPRTSSVFCSICAFAVVAWAVTLSIHIRRSGALTRSGLSCPSRLLDAGVKPLFQGRDALLPGPGADSGRPRCWQVDRPGGRRRSGGAGRTSSARCLDIGGPSRPDRGSSCPRSGHTIGWGSGDVVVADQGPQRHLQGQVEVAVA